MNHAFRQFSMGAVAIAIMQVASAQVSMTNIVPMSLADQVQKSVSCLMVCLPATGLSAF